MHFALILFTVLIEFMRGCRSCVFYPQNGGPILNLSELQNKSLIFENITFYNYEYSPCGNHAKCVSNNHYSMVNQVQNDNGKCTSIAYLDDNNVTQPEYNSDEQIFVFKYQNGDLCQKTTNESMNISIDIYWKCIYINEYQINSVKLIEKCQYEMYIDSNVACNDQNHHHHHHGNVHLSAGTWILISFFVLMFVYCIIGAFVNAWNGNGHQMPHYKFWMLLPVLVITGFQVTRDKICSRQDSYQQPQLKGLLN